MTERLPEARVRENGQVVAESHEWPAQPRHAQVVLVQRFPQRPAQGKERDEENHRERRRGEEPADTRFRRVVVERFIGHRFFAATSSRIRVRSTSAFIARAASCSARSGGTCPDSARCKSIWSNSESWE